jgi:acyl-coenzyme A synthetase/AMP-(fatty) acid ligase
VTGELYVGGVGVGRGYLGEAARTAECFVPDPFAQEAGARLYRTGDLARYRADGSLEFLGRRDSQVKVRGYRIELGEIEAVLGRQQGIAQAVVQVVGEQERSQLIAWVEANPEFTQSLSQEQVQHELRQVLPEYMVPTRILWRDQLPLTTNGKIDRQALQQQIPAEDV